MAIVIVLPGAPAGTAGGITVARLLPAAPAGDVAYSMSLWLAEFDGNQWHWSE